MTPFSLVEVTAFAKLCGSQFSDCCASAVRARAFSMLIGSDGTSSRWSICRLLRAGVKAQNLHRTMTAGPAILVSTSVASRHCPFPQFLQCAIKKVFLSRFVNRRASMFGAYIDGHRSAIGETGLPGLTFGSIDVRGELILLHVRRMPDFFVKLDHFAIVIDFHCSHLRLAAVPGNGPKRRSNSSHAATSAGSRAGRR